MDTHETGSERRALLIERSGLGSRLVEESVTRDWSVDLESCI